MGHITFHVHLSNQNDAITPVLWLEDGIDGGISQLGEAAKRVAEEYVADQITADEWNGEFGDASLLFLGTITVNSEKEIVDDAFFTAPQPGVEERKSPINF